MDVGAQLLACFSGLCQLLFHMLLQHWTVARCSIYRPRQDILVAVLLVHVTASPKFVP